MRKLLAIIFVLGVIGLAVGYLNLPGPETEREISREESLPEPAESSSESELPSLASVSPEPEEPDEEVASDEEASDGNPQEIPDAMEILFTVTFRGTVLVGGTDEPVSGAEVYVDGLDERIASTTTDGSGEFVLEVEVVAESYAYHKFINCLASGYALNQKEIASIGVVEDGAELFTIFSLTPGQKVAGLIRDEGSGVPIANASVKVYQSEGDRFSGMGDALLTTTSDAEGAYHFDTLAPGPYDFVVDGRDQGYVYDASAMRSANVEQGSDLSDFDFALNMGGVISGVVRDPQGDPVADAYIDLQPSEFDPTEFMEDGFSRFSDDRESNSTDDTGRFEIKGVEFERSLIVSVLANDYATSANGPIRVTKSHPSREIDFVLSAGSRLSGLVQFEDGTLALGYDVTLRVDSDSGFFAEMVGMKFAETDPSGAFTIEHVGAGDYTISAQNMNFDGEREISFSAMLPGGDDELAVSIDGINPLEGVVIVLANKPKGTGVIQGTVRLPDGTLASGVTVEARSSGSFMPGSRKAKTGTDGRFELAGLLKSTYDLSVRERSGAVLLDDVQVGSTVELRMGALIGLTGRVLDAQGKPVSDARLQLVDVGESEDSNMFSRLTSFFQNDSGVRTDDMGYFEIERVAVGAYQIKAKSVSKGSGISERIVVAAGRTIPNIEIRLVAGVAFAGSVEDADGRPVKGSTVTLFVAPPEGEMDAFASMMPFDMTDKEGVATSDDDGAFRIPNVEDGLYIVVASADGFAETRLDGVEIVGPGDTSGFHIVLNRGGCVSGIARVDGQTKAGLMVQLVGSTGNHQAMTDATGYYEICAIAAGSYMAMVLDMENFSPTDMAGKRPNFVDVGDGESVTLNLVPPADGVSVSGVVAVPAGGMGFAMLMEPGAISMSTPVWTRPSSMEMARAMVGQAMIGPDGSFDFGLVPPGTYQLQVFSMNLDLDNMDLENLEEMSTMVPQATIEREITVVAEEPLFIDLSSP